jgi:hypothetical protein
MAWVNLTLHTVYFNVDKGSTKSQHPWISISGGSTVCWFYRKNIKDICILPVEVLFITCHVLLHLQLQNQGQQQQTQQQQSILNTHSTISQSSSNSIASAETHNQSRPSVATRTTLEPNGIRPRKPCNCTKSQCLKLWVFPMSQLCYCFTVQTLLCYIKLKLQVEDKYILTVSFLHCFHYCLLLYLTMLL